MYLKNIILGGKYVTYEVKLDKFFLKYNKIILSLKKN